MEQETQIFDGTLTKPMMVDALNNTFFPQRANIYQVFNFYCDELLFIFLTRLDLSMTTTRTQSIKTKKTCLKKAFS
jgi:hypothetical protein